MNNVISWHTIKLSSLYAYFFSSPQGLSQLEAEQRKHKKGHVDQEQRHLFYHTLSGLPFYYFLSLVLITLGAIIEGYFYAAVAGIAVTLLYGIVFMREARYRIQWAMTLININREKVPVYRDAALKMHFPQDLVLGDVVLLQPNMVLPVTVRLIEADNLQVAMSDISEPLLKESINEIPGESPVTRALFPEEEWRLTNPVNMVLAGSFIKRGTGKGIVVDIPLKNKSTWLAERFHVEPLFSWDSISSHFSFPSVISAAVAVFIAMSIALDDVSHGTFEVILAGLSFFVLFFPVTAVLLRVHYAVLQINNLLRKNIAVRNMKVFYDMIGTSLVVADAECLLQDNVSAESSNTLSDLTGHGLRLIILTEKPVKWLGARLKGYGFSDSDVISKKQFELYSDKQLENVLKATCFFAEVNAISRQRLFQILKANGQPFILLGEKTKEELGVPKELRVLLTEQTPNALTRNATDILLLSNNTMEFLYTLLTLQQQADKALENTAILRMIHCLAATGVILAFLIGGGMLELVVISLFVLLILWNMFSVSA